MTDVKSEIVIQIEFVFSSENTYDMNANVLSVPNKIPTLEKSATHNYFDEMWNSVVP